MEFKNEEKSEFANDMYKLGKIAILRFAELLEKEGIDKNTGKVIEDASEREDKTNVIFKEISHENME